MPMPTISGYLHDVTAQSTSAREVLVRAPKYRADDVSVTTTESHSVPVDEYGHVSFTCKPGPAVLQIVYAMGAPITIPILVPESGDQGLVSVVTAATVPSDTDTEVFDQLLGLVTTFVSQAELAAGEAIEAMEGKADTSYVDARVNLKLDADEVSYGVEPGAVVRRGGSGQVGVPAAPEEVGDATSKAYVDDQVGGKLDASRVSAEVVADGVVQRDLSGQIVVPEVPAEEQHVTAKKYVDQLNAGALEYTDARHDDAVSLISDVGSEVDSRLDGAAQEAAAAAGPAAAAAAQQAITDIINEGSDAVGLVATSDPRLTIRGEGAPEGVVDAPAGALYVDERNGRMWRKTSAQGSTYRWSSLGDTELEGESQTAWAHATEQGARLPLGYRSDGRLDELARKVWREDVGQIYSSADDGKFGHVITSPEGHILLGFKKNGQIVAPGLQEAASGEGIPSWERWRHPSGALAPVHADTTRIVGWGSSTLAYMAQDLAGESQVAGASYVDKSRGGERIQQIAGRQGSTLIAFDPVTVPASGSVPLSPSDRVPVTSFLTTSGTLNGVSGTLALSNEQFVFTRAQAGAAVEVAAPVFVPSGFETLRGATSIIAAGKNNAFDAGAVDLVCEYTDRMVDFLTPMFPRFIVMGHHINGTWETTSDEYRNVLDINAYLEKKYGEVYFDLLGVITSPDIWEATGITPQQFDLNAQAELKLAPSLRRDGAHLNETATAAVAAMVMDKMRSLNWY